MKLISVKSVLLVCLILVFLPFARAGDFLIHVDSSGNAIFLGNLVNSSVILPNGVYLQNGELTGQTSSLTTKLGDSWNFTYSYPDSNLAVYLPLGSIINYTDGEVYVSNNQIVIYKMDNVTVSYTLDAQTSQSSFPFALVILIIILAALAFYYVKRPEKEIKIKSKEKKKIDIIREVLSDKEKSILDILTEKGKIKSSYLRKLSSITKSSFSRHIQELEKKKLIKRTGEGRNKFIEINKSYLLPKY